MQRQGLPSVFSQQGNKRDVGLYTSSQANDAVDLAVSLLQSAHQVLCADASTVHFSN